jgi:mannose-6-phosphate isomerase-like protein (cupin superfamily)
MPRRDQLKPLTEPTLIRHSDVPYIVWGDDESGFVNDLFHVLSEGMVLVTVTMPPGARFRSSDKFRAYFDTHECLYVLQGEYTCQDPETGEVRTARRGEMLFMPEKRWHYGYNFGSEELRLLECIAPPTNQAALAHVPRPKELVGLDRNAASNWPRDGVATENLRVCRRNSALNAIMGTKHSIRAEIFASTARVCFAILTLPPNARSGDLSFPFDICLHGDHGRFHVQVPGSGDYLMANTGDVVFLPKGSRFRLFNHNGAPAELLLGGAGDFGAFSVEDA